VGLAVRHHAALAHAEQRHQVVLAAHCDVAAVVREGAAGERAVVGARAADDSAVGGVVQAQRSVAASDRQEAAVGREARVVDASGAGHRRDRLEAGAGRAGGRGGGGAGERCAAEAEAEAAGRRRRLGRAR